MPASGYRSLFSVDNAPRVIVWSTIVLLAAGLAALCGWQLTGDAAWIQGFFTYPGALFFLSCSAGELYFAWLCWREYAPGDLLRPAWFLIVLSAISQIVGGLVSHVFAHPSRLNPFTYLAPASADTAIQTAIDVGHLFSPLSLVFLAWGLFYVVRASRLTGTLSHLRVVDIVLLGIVVGYTVYFVSSALVYAGRPGVPPRPVRIGLSMSDPILCVLLFEAILIRRSTANMGWGLISRCWLSFSVAILFTSAGDIGLWAAATGQLPYWLQIASWYVWFLASAGFVLGPVYQLQALRRATAMQPVAAGAEPERLPGTEFRPAMPPRG